MRSSIKILLPQTFRFGGVLLIAHSSITVGCFALMQDWKGGLLEFAFLQIPIVMVVHGYPSLVLQGRWCSTRSRR